MKLAGWSDTPLASKPGQFDLVICQEFEDLALLPQSIQKHGLGKVQTILKHRNRLKASLHLIIILSNIAQYCKYIHHINAFNVCIKN